MHCLASFERVGHLHFLGSKTSDLARLVCGSTTMLIATLFLSATAPPQQCYDTKMVTVHPKPLLSWMLGNSDFGQSEFLWCQNQ
jgi:hypothetical protein